jgi:hypothetical protein
MRHALPRHLDHGRGAINAVEPRVPVSFRNGYEIAPGTAADLQHGAAVRRHEAGNQRIAAKQETLARRVVDALLIAIEVQCRGR